MDAEHDENAGFLKAIVDDPDDLANYLIYADRIEERNDPRSSFHAELIRLQVKREELHRKHKFEVGTTDERNHEEAGPVFWRLGVMLNDFAQMQSILPDSIVEASAAARGEFHYSFRKGFVDTIQCVLHVWMAHGRDIVRDCPVSTVCLIDKRPRIVEMKDAWQQKHEMARWVLLYGRWRDACHNALPGCLRRFMPRPFEQRGYSYTYELGHANKSVSVALLGLARSDMKLNAIWQKKG